MEFKILLILHTLGACVWVGGHLILAITILPKALKLKDPEIISTFESMFERIGIPSLIIQVVTGLRLAMIFMPIGEWFDFSNSISALISIKIILLLITVILAIYARFFIIPKLDADKLSMLGWHIAGVTIIAVLMLLTGLSFRMGLF
ncbi:MAG: CopD family protein [Ignavibacteria bacterium]|nr:CopD family protein [Ignavibacteria bacterium]